MTFGFYAISFKSPATGQPTDFSYGIIEPIELLEYIWDSLRVIAYKDPIRNFFESYIGDVPFLQVYILDFI